MASEEGQLKTRVSDRLIALVGYSEAMAVRLVLRLARDSASAADLAARLVDLAGLPSSADTVAFAEDVHRMLPRRQGAAGAGVSEYQRQAREAAAFAKKQSAFKLLDGSDDADTAGVAAAPDNKNGKKRFRRRKGAGQGNDGIDEDDEAAATHDLSERNVRARRSPAEDAGSEEELEDIDRDQIERAELDRHIRERDAANTRKPMSRKPTRHEQERSEAMNAGDTSELRKLSRYAYLGKRTEKKVQEVRDEILDHEYLFHGVRLTDAEQREHRRKKEIHDLVQGRGGRDDDAGDYYRMPEAYDAAANVDQVKRFAVASQRYEEPDKAARSTSSFSEQEEWEEQQIRKSRLQFGSNDAGRVGDGYELLLDDAVDFVKSAVQTGADGDGEMDELADSGGPTGYAGWAMAYPAAQPICA